MLGWPHQFRLCTLKTSVPNRKSNTSCNMLPTCQDKFAHMRLWSHCIIVHLFVPRNQIELFKLHKHHDLMLFIYDVTLKQMCEFLTFIHFMLWFMVTPFNIFFAWLTPPISPLYIKDFCNQSQKQHIARCVANVPGQICLRAFMITLYNRASVRSPESNRIIQTSQTPRFNALHLRCKFETNVRVSNSPNSGRSSNRVNYVKLQQQIHRPSR